jgi:hypothetical protein
VTRMACGAAMLASILSLAACAGDGAHGGHGVAGIIEDAQQPWDSRGLTSTPFLPNRRTVPVATSAVSSDVPDFLVLERTSQLKKGPCAECHTVPLAELVRRRPAHEPLAHWNVTLAHASETVMACATCHSASDQGQLRLLGGTSLSIDHAYQVCAQCHSTQATDWAGGAHGKRVGGWAPPRVSYSCTECHDPHRPALTPRWPTHDGGPLR